MPEEHQTHASILAELVEEVRNLCSAVVIQSRTDEPMTRQEAAHYLKMHPDTLYKLARMNKIAYSRRGEGKRSTMVFLREDLDDYVNRNRIPAIE